VAALGWCDDGIDRFPRVDGGGRGGVEPDAGEPLPRLIDAGPELIAEKFAFCRLDQFDGSSGGGGGGGDGGGGEDEAAGAIHQEIDQRARTADKATGSAEGFAQGAHLDFDLGIQAELVDKAATKLAIESGGMCFVDHQPGTVMFLERNQFAQGRHIPIHGEYRFGDDQDPPPWRKSGVGGGTCLAGEALQDMFERVEVAMREDAEPGATQAGGIDDRGMDEPVDEDDVLTTEECADGAKGGAYPLEKERAASVPLN
jgi:hypothetical protein